MINFKANELVLVSNGEGGYMVRKFLNYLDQGEKCLILEGNYSTAYHTENIHKCPPSIKRLHK